MIKNVHKMNTPILFVLLAIFSPSALFAQGYLNQEETYLAPIISTEVFDAPPGFELVDTAETPQQQFFEYRPASCTATKDTLQTDEEVTWIYEINGAYTNATWSGETITGSSEAKITTRYTLPGTYTASLLVNRVDGSTDIVECGSVLVQTPPLSLTCGPSESYVTPGSCITWSVDILSHTDAFAVNWSGHDAINPQTNEEVTVCYPQKGTYLADVRVTDRHNSRTIYCGSVTVNDTPKKTQQETTFRNALENDPLTKFSGTCSSDKLYAQRNESVIWRARIDDEKPPEDTITWSGPFIQGRSGKTQEVIYSEPGEYHASFSLRTDDGTLLTYPCGNTIKIESTPIIQETDRTTTTQRIILLVLILIWLPPLTYRLLKRKKR